jgi:hypothetical protein
MAKLLYELQYGFEAPDLLKSEQVGSIITSYFEKGRVLLGEPYKKDRIIVDKRFIFPLEYLEKTNKLSNLPVSGNMSETLDRLSKETKEQKESFAGDSDVPLAEKVKKESNTFKNGALLGLGIGLVSALYFKKSILWFSLFGGAFGGYIATKIDKAKQGNNLDIKAK